MTRAPRDTRTHLAAGARKRPERRGRATGARCALVCPGWNRSPPLRALVPGLLAAIALQGCLVPQSVDPQSTRVRFPPRVRVEALDPQLSGASVRLTHGSIDQAAGCSCRLVLEVPQIEEDDPTVDLEVRWFADYDPDKPATQRPAVPSQFLSGSFDSSAVVRQGPKLEIDHTSFGLLEGTHAIDMVVAEQGGFDDVATTNAHRAMLPGYESATQRFTVTVTVDNDKPCRADSPWKRVCSTGGGP
jgi:hypothetical protein